MKTAEIETESPVEKLCKNNLSNYRRKKKNYRIQWCVYGGNHYVLKKTLKMKVFTLLHIKRKLHKRMVMCNEYICVIMHFLKLTFYFKYFRTHKFQNSSFHITFTLPQR